MGFIRKHKRGQDPYGSTPQGKRVPGKKADGAHNPSRMWRGGQVSEDTDPTPAHGMVRPSEVVVDTDPTSPYGIPRPSDKKKSSKKKS